MIEIETLQRVLGMDPNYLHVFRPDEIQVFNKGIFPRRVNGELELFSDCPIRNKEVQLGPEEYIRQLYTRRLLETYKYPKDRLKFEYPISSDQEIKRADIVVLSSDPQEPPHIIVEIKKSGLLKGKVQLRIRFHFSFPKKDCENALRTLSWGIPCVLQLFLHARFMRSVVYYVL